MLKFLLRFPALLPAILIVATVLGGVGGWSLRDRDYQSHLKQDAEAAATAQRDVRKVEARNEDTGREVGVQVEEAKVEIRYVTRTIIQKVPEYVTVEADARCTVPVGAVLLLNAAASGNPPPALAPGESADAPSGVDLSAVVSVTADNYGTYHEVSAQLRGWQEWWARVEKDWPHD